jgi:site-specific DNA-methyltransferase (adenine-specific)
VSWELHLGECIEGMAALADKSVDHVIADPEYSEHVHTSARTLAGIYSDTDEMPACGSRRLELGFSHLTAENRRAYAAQYARLARRWVLVFSDTESSHLWRADLESFGLQSVRTCFWHKLAGAPQFTGDRPAVCLEAITVCHAPGRKKWNGGGKQGFYPHAIVQSAKGNPRLHPTQKPRDLMAALVADFTDLDDLILDSHAGSGTTGVACIELGRRFIGFEKDPKHHAAATERLRNAQRQERLAFRPMVQVGLDLSSDRDLP